MKGYDFLELDESQFITESNVEEISSYTTDIGIDSISTTFSGWDYSGCYPNNYNGGYNTMNTYENYTPCV